MPKAKSSVFIAVAGFTDKDIFDLITKKALSGIKVEVILIKDETNSNSGINFSNLFENGGKVWMIEEHTTMHNKFCVIDDEVVINGSYNWTYKAMDDHENIMIITGHFDTVINYIDQFKSLKKQYFGTEKEAYHKLSLRLTALKNLIGIGG